jgi:fructosamine-3-kinase
LLALWEAKNSVVPRPRAWGSYSTSHKTSVSTDKLSAQTSCRPRQAVGPDKLSAQTSCQTGRAVSRVELSTVVQSSMKTPTTETKSNMPRVYFLLLDFVDNINDLPDASVFGANLAAIHSQTKSPTGKFGFHTENCHVKFPQFVEWHESWTVFFTKLLQGVFDIELQVHGRQDNSDEYVKEFEKLITSTIPQLLDHLNVKPCLVHGNLSRENIATNLATGEPVVFGPSALYAHNEYELGMWRRKLGRLGREFFKEYHKHYPIDEPLDQWDDRALLYSIKFNLAYSISVPDSGHIREQYVTPTSASSSC